MKKGFYRCVLTKEELAQITAERLRLNKSAQNSIRSVEQALEGLLGPPKRRKLPAVLVSDITNAMLSAKLLVLLPGITSVNYSDKFSLQLMLNPDCLFERHTPPKKFNLTDAHNFKNNTQEEQEFYAKIKESLTERWKPGQLIDWFDFWNWLHSYLEGPVYAGFVLHVLILLSREKIIKHVDMGSYELI